MPHLIPARTASTTLTGDGGTGPQNGVFQGRRFWLAVAACLILQQVLAIDCARQWTPTHDEFWHLPIGLRMWKSGKFDDDVINPPPIRLWAAIPLAVGGANAGDLNAKLDVGEIGDAFWAANPEHVRFWFLMGRLMIIPLLAITGLCIVVWSRHWYGQRAALITALLWCCCPTVLANAAIVTHDLPLAAAWSLTLYALVRFAEQPSWTRALSFGAMIGIAAVTKLTGLILFPLCVGLWWVLRILPAQASSQSTTTSAETKSPTTVSRPKIMAFWIAAIGLSIVMINAAYLFRNTGESLASLPLSSSRLKAIQSLWGIGKVPVPLPREFVAALDRLAQDLERRHPVYLDGEWSDQPFLRYYAAALSYKLPLSTLILLGFGLAGIAWPRPGTQDRRYGLFLITAALVLPIMASGSSNQIGIRYVLPTLPILFVLAGQSARWIDFRSHRWPSRIVLAALLIAPLSLRFHPHHLAYFNLLAGGPAGGRWHLVDSNIDWGQDLHGLKQYLDQHGIQDVGLAYFGTVVPTQIGIQSHQPPSRFPQPGWYAVSVNFVQGRPHALRDANGNRVQVGIDEFGYFRFFEPVARIGYSIYVYRLSQQDIRRFAAAMQQSALAPTSTQDPGLAIDPDEENDPGFVPRKRQPAT